MNSVEESHYNFKGLFKYVSTVLSWTVFVILSLIAVFLLYYYISFKLYTSFGDKFEPMFSVYTIITESMDPTIKRYDVIVNTKVTDENDVKINDVITFISTGSTTYGMTITHRVIGTKTTDTGEICYVTRGDNNTEQDLACVTPNNVIGVVRAVIPSLGQIQKVLSSGFGWILLILIPALYIIIKDVLKIFRLSKGLKNDENERKNIKNNFQKELDIDKKSIDYEDEEKNKNKDNDKEPDLKATYDYLKKIKKK